MQADAESRIISTLWQTQLGAEPSIGLWAPRRRSRQWRVAARADECCGERGGRAGAALF